MGTKSAGRESQAGPAPGQGRASGLPAEIEPGGQGVTDRQSEAGVTLRATPAGTRNGGPTRWPASWTRCWPGGGVTAAPHDRGRARGPDGRDGSGVQERPFPSRRYHPAKRLGQTMGAAGPSSAVALPVGCASRRDRPHRRPSPAAGREPAAPQGIHGRPIRRVAGPARLPNGVRAAHGRIAIGRGRGHRTHMCATPAALLRA